MADPPPFLPDPQRDKQQDGPVHVLDAGRYFATVDPDGVPRIYRADTVGAVLHVEDDDFYGLFVGDKVSVHGQGFGRIVEAHRAEYPSGDYVVVEIERSDVHQPSGQTITWTETLQRHPRNVSLDSRVAQARWRARCRTL